MPFRQHTNGSNTLFMSTMDVWSNLRWISASNMTLDSIIFTPQVNMNLQIWGQLGLGWCSNCIRVHSYALETAHQWLKHFVNVYYGCMKWSEVDISLNHGGVASFPLLKWVWTPKSGSNLAGIIIRVQPYALETACQWVKHFVYVSMLPKEQELIPEYWVNIFRASVHASPHR